MATYKERERMERDNSVSLWRQFTNMMRGEDPYGGTPIEIDGVPTVAKKVKRVMVLPDFTDLVVIKGLVNGISSYDWKYNNKYERHVDKILDEIFENIDKVELKSTARIQYNKYSIYADSFYSMCEVTVRVDSKSHAMSMSEVQIAKARFIVKHLGEEQERKEMKELDEFVGVNSEFKSTRLKGGVLKISEDELLESLLKTHPQHFI